MLMLIVFEVPAKYLTLITQYWLNNIMGLGLTAGLMSLDLLQQRTVGVKNK